MPSLPTQKPLIFDISTNFKSVYLALYIVRFDFCLSLRGHVYTLFILARTKSLNFDSRRFDRARS